MNVSTAETCATPRPIVLGSVSCSAVWPRGPAISSEEDRRNIHVISDIKHWFVDYVAMQKLRFGSLYMNTFRASAGRLPRLCSATSTATSLADGSTARSLERQLLADRTKSHAILAVISDICLYQVTAPIGVGVFVLKPLVDAEQKSRWGSLFVSKRWVQSFLSKSRLSFTPDVTCSCPQG